MQVRIVGNIRGETIHIEWRAGTITGGPELVDRARRLHRRTHGEEIDEADPVAFISALELASPEHLEVHVEPDPVGNERRGVAL